MLVFQVIEKAGNRGIWKQDIRFATNLPQQSLDKNIKLLEQRLLIKNVRSVGSKTKKLYMLYELAPAKEITGGPWYTDQEFDHEFVEALRTFILQVVCAQGIADLQTISQRVKLSGISTVDLAEEELEMVLCTLIYDGKLEQVDATDGAVMTHLYRAALPTSAATSVTEVPCGVCPLVSQCREGGVISPASCEYMTKWLELADVPAGTTSELSW